MIRRQVPTPGPAARAGRRCAAGAAAVLLLVVAAGCSGPARAGSSAPTVTPTRAVAEQEFTLAVLGDLPYTARQRRQFPQIVKQVNADPDTGLVVHVGDVRDNQPCTTAVYSRVQAQFAQFADPVVYTFGDNDWADCSRVGNGRYDPLERLATLRRVFAGQLGSALGPEFAVSSRGAGGLPENVAFERERVSFAVLHIVGSGNDTDLWAGRDDLATRQAEDAEHRLREAEALVKRAFTIAGQNNDRAVVLVTHADLFANKPGSAGSAPYRPLIRTIAEQAAGFRGPVYLLNGDSHVYREDQPLGPGSPWPAALKVPEVDHLTRITVDGGPRATGWLKVTVEPYYVPVLRWERIPFPAVSRP